MQILLRANITRLKKDRLFWLGNLLMFAYGIYTVVSKYKISVDFQSTFSLNEMIFGYAFIVGIVTAIFISFFWEQNTETERSATSWW